MQDIKGFTERVRKELYSFKDLKNDHEGGMSQDFVDGWANAILTITSEVLDKIINEAIT